MTGGEASIASALGAPAGAFASDLAGGVHAKTADGHEDMRARLHPDGDEAAHSRLAIAGELLAGEAAVQQSCLHQHVRSAAGAVISAVFDIAMAAAEHIGLVLQSVGSIDGELECLRSGGADTGEAAIKADLRVASVCRAGSGSALGCGSTLSSGLASCLLLSVVVSPGACVGLLLVVVRPSLLLSVGSLRLLSRVVSGSVVAILGFRRRDSEEAGGKGEDGDRFHGCASGSEF